MSKKDDQVSNNDMSLLDALLRVKTLENILLGKGIITREEYYKELEEVACFVAKQALQKANIPGDLDEILDGFKKDLQTTKGVS